MQSFHGLVGWLCDRITISIIFSKTIGSPTHYRSSVNLVVQKGRKKWQLFLKKRCDMIHCFLHWRKSWMGFASFSRRIVRIFVIIYRYSFPLSRFRIENSYEISFIARFFRSLQTWISFERALTLFVPNLFRCFVRLLAFWSRCWRGIPKLGDHRLLHCKWQQSVHTDRWMLCG